eukprot:1480150-Rhodomonas_salina.1
MERGKVCERGECDRSEEAEGRGGTEPRRRISERDGFCDYLCCSDIHHASTAEDAITSHFEDAGKGTGRRGRGGRQGDQRELTGKSAHCLVVGAQPGSTLKLDDLAPHSAAFPYVQILRHHAEVLRTSAWVLAHQDPEFTQDKFESWGEMVERRSVDVRQVSRQLWASELCPPPGPGD